MNDEEIIDWWIDAYNKHAPFCGYNDGDRCDECENIIQEVINKARVDERAKVIQIIDSEYIRLQEANKKRIEIGKESFTPFNVAFIALDAIKQQIEAIK